MGSPKVSFPTLMTLVYNLYVLTVDKSKVEISQNFVSFSKYANFNLRRWYFWTKDCNSFDHKITFFSQLVQTCLKVFKLYKTCQGWFRTVQIGPNWSEPWFHFYHLSYEKVIFKTALIFLQSVQCQQKKLVILSRLFYFYFCTLGTFGQKMARLLTGSSSTTEWLSGLEVVLWW